MWRYVSGLLYLAVIAFGICLAVDVAEVMTPQAAAAELPPAVSARKALPPPHPEALAAMATLVRVVDAQDGDDGSLMERTETTRKVMHRWPREQAPTRSAVIKGPQLPPWRPVAATGSRVLKQAKPT